MKSSGWQKKVRGLAAVVEPDWAVSRPANVHHELASPRSVIAQVLINRGGGRVSDRVSDRRSWRIV